MDTLYSVTLDPSASDPTTRRFVLRLSFSSLNSQLISFLTSQHPNVADKIGGTAEEIKGKILRKVSVSS